MKILDAVEAKVGRWALGSVAIALVILLLVIHFVWHPRKPEQAIAPIAPAPGVPAVAPPGSPTPPPVAAVAQATATTTTHFHIVLRRWPTSGPAAPLRGEVPARRGKLAETATAYGSDAPLAAPSAGATDSPPIEIDVTTTTAASTSAAATAPAPATGTFLARPQLPTHGRIGVLAATVPGVLAVDVEALQVRTPWWLIGQPVEVGLDAEASLAEAGAGIALGSKVFAEAGGFVTYKGIQPGICVGAGLRF